MSANNSVPAGDLAALINQVHTALTRVSSGQSELPSEPLKPAISVKKSIAPDFIVCLEDGKKFKSLKRHLRTQYKMTPEQYREKWGLAPDYPMVAPNYAAARSQLAKQIGTRPAASPPQVNPVSFAVLIFTLGPRSWSSRVAAGGCSGATPPPRSRRPALFRRASAASGVRPGTSNRGSPR